MNARTGSVPWDLSGRAKTPEEYKAWLEGQVARAKEKEQNKPDTEEQSMPYDYIKRSYDFQPEVGKRVRHLETGNAGVISRENFSMSHYVMVRFDERKHSTPCHPGALEYLPEAAPRT